MFYFDQPDLGLSREFLIKGLQAKEVQVKLNIEYLIYRNMNINMSYSSKMVMFITASEQLQSRLLRLSENYVKNLCLEKDSVD
jgi:hypothetical protein